MRKSEIIQVALIIMGIGIIVRSLESTSSQLSFFVEFFSYSQDFPLWVIISIVGVLTFMVIIGLLLIFKSGYFARKVILDESENKVQLSLGKSDALYIAIIILSLYFLIFLFPATLNALSNILLAFFTDFHSFLDVYLYHLWSVILYVGVLIIFFKAGKIATWVERTTGR